MGLALNLFCKLISQSKYIATIELIEKVHFFSHGQSMLIFKILDQ